MGMDQAWLIPAIPAVAFVILLIAGPYLPRRGDWLAILAIGASFVLVFPVLADLLDQADGTHFVAGEKAWEWISFDLAGVGETFEIEIGFYVDPITIVMLAVVTLVALMVQIYSIAYMNGDARYGWYFTCISLFAASMLTLVLSNNLLLLYAGWEAVGFCSFLLIGFWWEKRSAAEAAKKAFITTRIGDVGLLIGIIMLWHEGPNT
ncbi:MAG TPA: proton-conducting transporter membrane subunit, partial [Dehalococcoidia bacterium]